MKYRHRLVPENLADLGPWSKRRGLTVLMLRVVQPRMRRHGPAFRKRDRGKPWGTGTGRPWRFRRQLRAALAKANGGDVIQYQVGGNDGPVFAVLAVDPSPPLTDTIGNSRVDRIVGWTLANFPGVESFGICNRRPIDGTDPPVWTQHCPWPAPDPGANAWDFHHDDFEVQKRIALGLGVQGQLWADTNGKRGVPVGKILHDRQVWRPDEGWRPAPNLADPHIGHGHVEGDPERTGDPRAGCP